MPDALLDENPSATPLDLLLNAISGSGHYAFADDAEETVIPGEREDAAMAAFLEHDVGESESRKRKVEDTPQRTAVRTLFPAPAGEGLPHKFSTIEVWHPKTGQKSYGKERRILQPPPTLRVRGPILPLLNTLTLSSHPNPDPAEGKITFSSQTHRFLAPRIDEYEEGQSPPPPPPSRKEFNKRFRRQAAKTGWGSTLPWERSNTGFRDREELSSGLTFPGLWIGEQTGKSKAFRLELTVGPLGANGAVYRSPDDLTTHAEAPMPVRLPMDDAELRRVLEEEDPLMSLSAAEAGVPPEMAMEASLQTQERDQPRPTEATRADSSQPWATLSSDPLTIVSKPSQKSAKARSLASCLSVKDAFALIVRVNAQTVRTKFMNTQEAADGTALAAKTGKWTPFRFHVVERAVAPEPEDRSVRSRFKLDVGQEGVITYGSIVQLVDAHSGSKSETMRIVRVDKNQVVIGADHGHPVSELQRVGLVMVVNGQDLMVDGERQFLSAPSARAGGGEVKPTRARPGPKVASAAATPMPMPETLGGMEGMDDVEANPAKRRKIKTKRNALAKVAIDEEEDEAVPRLVWHGAARHEGEHVVVEGKVATKHVGTIETVDDWMCWVLTGVSSFSYSFFTGNGHDEAETLPQTNLGDVPRLLLDPFYRNDHALDITLSYFYFPNGDGDGPPVPMSVYIGPIGPLEVSTWRSIAPMEKYYDPGALYPAMAYLGDGQDALDDGQPRELKVFSNFPYNVPHVIAHVSLPPIKEIVRVMQRVMEEEAGAAPVSAPEASSSKPRDADEDWLDMGPGELTIQEALRNASKEELGDVHKTAAEGADNAPSSAAADKAAELTLEQIQAHFRKDEFSLDQLPDQVPDQLPEPLPEHLIDPSLADTIDAGQAPPPATGETGSGGGAAIQLQRPERTVAQSRLAALPIFLLRPDGVGHGIGWNMVAQRDGSNWGLRVVQTSLHG